MWEARDAGGGASEAVRSWAEPRNEENAGSAGCRRRSLRGSAFLGGARNEGLLPQVNAHDLFIVSSDNVTVGEGRVGPADAFSLP